MSQIQPKVNEQCTIIMLVYLTHLSNFFSTQKLIKMVQCLSFVKFSNLLSNSFIAYFFGWNVREHISKVCNFSERFSAVCYHQKNYWQLQNVNQYLQWQALFGSAKNVIYSACQGCLNNLSVRINTYQFEAY